MRTRGVGILSACVAAALIASSCGGGKAAPGGDGSKVPTLLGPGEGRLNLIAWPGYVEDGSNDPAFDWVSPFEQQTGCMVSVKYSESSDEMVALMRQGNGTLYDGVSASGDAAGRLIAGGSVAQINVALMPDWASVLPPLRSPPYDTVNGRPYGVPFMYGPNFLMYNPDVVKPAPTSWDVTFRADSPYKGKVTAYDVPIFIADASLYLKSHRPDLGITDPYELTPLQLDAAVALLRTQKTLVGRYWSAYTSEIDGFESGAMVAGVARPITLSIIGSDKRVPVAGVVPSEGVTGWVDTWMMSSHAQHPNCMYRWMQWTMTAQVQSQVAQWYGAAPSNANACYLLRQAVGDVADTLRYGECGNPEFLKSMYLWKTPQADCGNGRTDCTDYSVWRRRWNEVRGE